MVVVIQALGGGQGEWQPDLLATREIERPWQYANDRGERAVEASGSVERAALIEMGLVLFGITMIFQIVSQIWLRRAARTSGGRA